MKAKQLIGRVSQILRRHRWFNILLSAICPLLAFALVLRLGSLGIVPQLFAVPLLLLVVLAALFITEKALPSFGAPAEEEAAKLIDRAVDGKDRFLTIATFSGNDLENSVEAVNRQGDALAAAFNPQTALRFKLERHARYSALLSPLLLAALLFLAGWSRPRLAEGLKGALPEAPGRPDEFRELAETPAKIPAQVREQLAALAETIDEKGIEDRETLQLIDETLETIEQIEESEMPAEKIAPEKIPESNPPEEQSPPPETQDLPEDRQSSSQQSSLSKPGDKQQGSSSSQEQSAQDQSAQEQHSQQQSSSGGSESSAAAGQQGKGNQQSGSGKQGGDGKQGEKAREEGAGSSSSQNDKVGETGVGEGKGKGKSGAEKEQKGETQSGQDDTNAKEGDAQNKTSGAGKAQGGASSDSQNTGQSGDQSGEKSGRKGQQEGQQQGGETKDLEGVKEKLNDLKDEIEKKGDKQGEQRQQEAGKEGAQQQDQQGLQGERGEGGQNSSGSNQQGGKQGEQNQAQKGNRDGKEQAQDNEQKSRMEKGQDRGKQKETKSQEPGKQQNESPAEAQQEGKETERQATRDTTEMHADKRPAPSDTAQQFGPFDGGKDGDVLGGVKEKVEVDVPEEGKILINRLGSEDPRRFEHKGETSAKTGLGSAEFQKPEADVSKSRQPIPVEYRDLLVR